MTPPALPVADPHGANMTTNTCTIGCANYIVIPIGCTCFNGFLAILVNASIGTHFALLQVRIFYPSISYNFAYGPMSVFS